MYNICIYVNCVGGSRIWLYVNKKYKFGIKYVLHIFFNPSGEFYPLYPPVDPRMIHCIYYIFNSNISPYFVKNKSLSIVTSFF